MTDEFSIMNNIEIEDATSIGLETAIVRRTFEAGSIPDDRHDIAGQITPVAMSIGRAATGYGRAMRACMAMGGGV